MSDPIGGIGEAEEFTGKVLPEDLIRYQQSQYEGVEQHDTFLSVAETAIEKAIHRPSGSSDISSERQAILGGRDSATAQEKDSIISDVGRPGTEKIAENNDVVEESLNQRLTSLYADLTSYQVSWKIAQKIPQDLSQLLKGS